MILYTGNPRTLAVTRFADGGSDSCGPYTRQSPLDPRLDVVNHSPTGFAWGYWGSGPAQLAFALIADALASRAMIKDFRPSDVELAIRHASNPTLYQAFKQDVIGKIPQALGWSMTDADIIAWIDAFEADRDRRPAVQS